MSEPINSTSIAQSKLECTKREQGVIQIDTVIWTVSNFEPLLAANRGELQITCSNTAIGGKEYLIYNLKIRSDPRDQYGLINVYFQSHESVLVGATVTVNKHESDDSNEFDDCFYDEYNERSTFRVLRECKVAEPYKWIFLNSDYGTSDCCNLVLKFKFKTYNSDRMNKILGVTRSVDFGELLTNEMLYDAIIKSNDGEEFKAHKVILAFRSSVLKTKFETNLNEDTPESKSVVKTVYSSKVVQQLLKFIYTNRADINEMIDVHELLDAAEHYHIDGLKKLCEGFLCGQITLTNAIQYIELALRYHLKILEREVLEFARCNWTSLVKTEAWANLNSIEVVKRLAECFSSF